MATRFWGEPAPLDNPIIPSVVDPIASGAGAASGVNLDLSPVIRRTGGNVSAMGDNTFYARAGDREVAGELGSNPATWTRSGAGYEPPAARGGTVPAGFFERPATGYNPMQQAALADVGAITGPQQMAAAKGLIGSPERRAYDRALAERGIAKTIEQNRDAEADRQAGIRGAGSSWSKERIVFEEKKLVAQNAWKQADPQNKIAYLEKKYTLDMATMTAKDRADAARMVKEYGLRAAELGVKLINDKDLKAMTFDQALVKIDREAAIADAAAARDNDFEGQRDIAKVREEARQRAWTKSQEPTDMFRRPDAGVGAPQPGEEPGPVEMSQADYNEALTIASFNTLAELKKKYPNAKVDQHMLEEAKIIAKAPRKQAANKYRGGIVIR